MHNSTNPAEAVAAFFEGGIQAGFPSPADDHLDGKIDLLALLFENEPATFVARASGDSMVGAGIFHGDLLIINRALTARDGSIVVAELQGEFTLKRLRYHAGKPWLCPENVKYRPLRVTEEMSFMVWGVVKHSIRVHRSDGAVV
jgi:DNA polymerase V